MFDWTAFVLAEPHVEEAQERRTLTVFVRVDERFVRLDRRVGNRASRRTQLPAQVRPREVSSDPFERAEEERLVLSDRSSKRPAPLLAMEAVAVRAIRQLARQRLVPLKMEDTAVERVGARLGDDIDDAPGGAPEFRRCAGGDHLEFLHRFERDVDRRTLAAGLLAEEPVVVVPAVQADVV